MLVIVIPIHLFLPYPRFPSVKIYIYMNICIVCMYMCFAGFCLEEVVISFVPSLPGIFIAKHFLLDEAMTLNVRQCGSYEEKLE